MSNRACSIRILCLAAWAAVTVSGASAQGIDRPVRILVGFAAGGTADLIARVAAEKMKDTLGQPVVVENRPGAIGRIAIDAVKAAAPDGTTLMVMPIGPMAVVPHAYKNVSYDPISDFAPVSLGATFYFAFATGPMTRANNWGEFTGWLKANPAKGSYATSGAGSLPHFFGVMLGRELGTEMVHVPYKGSAAYLGELAGGQIPGAIDTVADLSELHRGGKIRILASTGPTRTLPDVPTFRELGMPQIDASGWFGFFAPARTPKPVVDQLNRAIVAAIKHPEVIAKLLGVGMTPATSTPEEFARIVADDFARWGPIVKASGFTPD